jgi:deoxyribonuclease-4
MLLGAHVSTAGGMPNAVQAGLDLGCEAIQVFTRNQRQWNPRPLDPAGTREFRARARAAGYLPTAVSHASYLINLCATDEAVLERSRAAFTDEIRRCGALGIPFLCVHPGAHLGAGEHEGIERIAESVRMALKETRGARVSVLLENTAGQGTVLGHRLEHLAELVRLTRSRRVGVCIDTCHLFAAGYDLRGVKAYERSMNAIGESVGFERVRAVHLNDSRHPCGARRDRHEHIGEGRIGSAAFRRLVNDERFSGRPGLLETPGGSEHYPRNLKRLQSMRKRRSHG